jgi:hypothetical protein
MTQPVGMIGSPPVLTITPVNPEAAKYKRMWAFPQYRKVAPGEELAMTFLTQAKPPAGAHVIDFGTGTGRGAMMLALLGQCKVTMVDFAGNCLDPEVQQACTTQPEHLQFVKADLEQPMTLRARYGYCTDVMEHIPPEKVSVVLTNILLSAQHVFFAIALTDDVCGTLIGEPLHLTVRPAAWWLEQLTALGALVHWSEAQPERLLVYVTAWMTGRQIAQSGVVNTEMPVWRANVEHNLQQGWQQVIPHPTTDAECLILGGGPTLNTFTDEIKERRAAGAKLITMNGTYNWALEHGLTPSATVIADARAFNARFTHPVVAGCRYLIGSHCDPSVLEGLPKDRTFLWHMNPEELREVFRTYLPNGYFPIPGGSTVLLRTIPMLRMLGYAKFHLYGCDSCLLENQHHAYPQPENNGGTIIPVVVNAPNASNRVFHCAPWMVSQAEEFVQVVHRMGDAFELEIHGEGLLAELLTTAATMDVGTAVPSPAKES